jgi:hypothetical protein
MGNPYDGRLINRWTGSGWALALNKAIAGHNSVSRRATDEITTFSQWLALGPSGTKGIIGEIGVPNLAYTGATPGSNAGDIASWAQVARDYLNYVDELVSIEGFTAWAAGDDFEGNPLAIYCQTGAEGGALGLPPAGANGTPSGYVGPSSVLEPYFTLGNTSYRGVNVAGPDHNSEGPVGTASTVVGGGYFSNANLGIYGTDYWYPTTSDVAFLAGRGVKRIRLSVRWERLQPSLDTALATAEVNRILAVGAACAANGISMTVMIWNMLHYITEAGGGIDSPSVVNTITMQGSSPNVANLVDFWTRLSNALNGQSGIAAYDLMNEPASVTEGTPSGANLIADGNFETDTIGTTPSGYSVGGSATLVVSNAEAYSGSQSLLLTATATGAPNAQMPQISGLSPALTYQLSAWLLGNQPSNEQYQLWSISINWYNSAGTYLENSGVSSYVVPNSSGWSNFLVNIVPPPGSSRATIKFYPYSSLSSGQAIYIDDITLEVVTSPLNNDQSWQEISQAVYNGVRNNGDNTEIWVSMAGVAPPSQSFVRHPQGPWLTGVSGSGAPTNVLYECHHYWDYAQSSGGLYLASFGPVSTGTSEQGYDQNLGY